MPRPLVIGNGKITVTFDCNLEMRDFFYPYVGQWNHLQGNRNRLGVWTEGKFSWVSQPVWEKCLSYKEDALVTDCRAFNAELEVSLLINDAVHRRENIYLKRVVVQNLSNREREIRLFFGQDFSVDENEVGDTVFFDPFRHVLCHYKRNRYFLFTGKSSRGFFDQFATGVKGFGGAEGTWRDAEDGVLSGNAIAQGSVDSAIGFNLFLPPWGEETIFYWICAGRNIQEVRALDQFTRDQTMEELLFRVETFSRAFLSVRPREEQAVEDLSPALVKAYRRSLLVVRVHVDDEGAIIASPDSDILCTNRDHYCYLWPRDGAFIAYSLIKTGYGRLTRKFFEFCANALTDKGYLLHKYNPDGTVGSSWHPWLAEGVIQLPIQEDETALVIWALWEYYQEERDLEFVLKQYHAYVRPAAHFLCNYVDQSLRLPAESYDLWEERRGIFTYTASTVYAGLKAAEAMAELFGQPQLAQRYHQSAEEVREGILKHLYDPDRECFLRGLIFNRKTGCFEPDPTVDSSVAGVFLFGVLPPHDHRVGKTMEKVRETLWVKTEVGGIARYYGDYYFRQTEDLTRAPGNPWIICTLWLAQYYLRIARSIDELRRARELLEWSVRHSLPTGVMPEQLHPFTGAPLSVAPLAWSHSTYVVTFQEYCARYRELLRSREELQFTFG
ncbi:glycoside hydrolase family 15 protein [Desulfothermobacter acidiphilus]|uniref:glycoside hydrolase family 15 protein n=1 Tax=Desulfothermobacter acidiphilus TaxID=1938353 RepID=UPI003F8CB9D6